MYTGFESVCKFVKGKKMEKYLRLFIFCFVLHKTSAVIYRLNATEYERLPPVFSLDSYESCMADPYGLHCMVTAALVTDSPSPLLDVMREYSAHTSTHYNHTIMRYALCVTSTCKKFYKNTTSDLRVALEACLNETLWEKYQLKTKLEDRLDCSKPTTEINIDESDIAVAILSLAIILLNCVGSLYDVFYTTGNKGEGIRILVYFSVRRNWRRLVAPAADGPEPRLKRLKGFYGIKTMTTILVITAHALLPAAMFIDNAHYIENLYYDLGYQLFYNGPVLVQTFFIISGFLLVYNIQLYSEKHTLNWTMVPKGIILRWIRLTPPYALVLAFTATWMRYAGSGPVWGAAVLQEVEDCRKYWWENLIYISNYNDKSQCILQSWYLAADTQLYCLGLIICVLCKSGKSRKVVLSLLLLAGLIIPAVQTYLQDLDGIVIVAPEAATNFFIKDATYNNLYKRGHTNLFNYVLGLALGFIVYHGQQINIDVQKYRKYRLLYWSTLLVSVCIMMSGSVFYQDRPRHSMLLRMLFAAFMKPIYGVLLAIGLAGMIFKYENVYRGFAEWKVWTTPGRVTYSAYILHLSFIRIIFGLETHMRHASPLQMAQQILLIVVVSFAAAYPFWLLVEAPFGQLVQLFMGSEKENSSDVKDTIAHPKGFMVTGILHHRWFTRDRGRCKGFETSDRLK